MKMVFENITPTDKRCSLGGCPSVHSSPDELLIVGKIPDASKLAMTDASVGEGEAAITVSRELMKDYDTEILRNAKEAIVNLVYWIERIGREGSSVLQMSGCEKAIVEGKRIGNGD